MERSNSCPELDFVDTTSGSQQNIGNLYQNSGWRNVPGPWVQAVNQSVVTCCQYHANRHAAVDERASSPQVPSDNESARTTISDLWADENHENEMQERAALLAPHCGRRYWICLVIGIIFLLIAAVGVGWAVLWACKHGKC